MLKRTSWITLVVLALLAAGCASGGGGAPAAPAGPSDEELVTQLINSTLAALQAKDVEKMMSVYTDDFSTSDGQSKADFTQFLADAGSQGFLDGMTADISALAVTVDGDSASVSGITIEGAFGVLDLSFDLTKASGSWMISGQSQQ